MLILLGGGFSRNLLPRPEYFEVDGVDCVLRVPDFGWGSGDVVAGHHQKSGAATVVHLDLAAIAFLSGEPAPHQGMNAGAGDAVLGVGVQLFDLLGHPFVDDHPVLDAVVEV